MLKGTFTQNIQRQLRWPTMRPPIAVYLGNLMEMAPSGFADALGIRGTAEELKSAVMDVAPELAG
jgi:hypothetical protein